LSEVPFFLKAPKKVSAGLLTEGYRKSSSITDVKCNKQMLMDEKMENTMPAARQLFLRSGQIRNGS
jgi:hypothetical protein